MRSPRSSLCCHRRGRRSARALLGAAAASLVASLVGACARSSATAPAEPTSGGAVLGAPVEASAALASTPPELAPTSEATGRPVPPSPSGGCGKPGRGGGALVARAGGLKTPVLLTLPEGYGGATPVPLVFAFHGRTRSHQSLHDTDASGLREALGRQYAVELGQQAAPWSEYWMQNVAATPEPRRVTDHFVLAEQTQGELSLGFQFAGLYARQVPVTLCVDEVSLTLAPAPAPSVAQNRAEQH